MGARETTIRAMLRGLLGLAAGVALLLPGATGRASTVTDAQGGGGGESRVDEYMGEYTYGIPLKVPGFHGLEPGLALGYSSSAANGYVGMGWALQGLSTIERVSIRGGAPGYNGSDAFQLDGELLVPCPSSGSLSPSCTTGGNYSTKLENFEKIVADSTVLAGSTTNYTASSAGPKWTIYGRDGTQSVYIPYYEVPIGSNWFVWQWALVSRTDTHGNTVTYNWGNNQLSGTWDYPSSITYNGTTIQLYWEQRGDVIYRGNGVAVEKITGRIKTIDVLVGGTRVRSYALTYATSQTGKSLLASVQEYGRDATLDSTGTVTGGTALPASTFTYDQSSPGQLSQSAATAPPSWCSPNAANCINTAVAHLVVGDFNGDGMTDFMSASGTTGGMFDTWIANSSANGGFTYTKTAPPTWCSSAGSCLQADARKVVVGDFNGDGMTDFMSMNGNFDTWLANGDGTFRYGGGTTPPSWCNGNASTCVAGASSWVVTGDFNGDGMTDFMIANGNFDTWLSNGNGTFTYAWATPPPSYCNGNAYACRWTADTWGPIVGDFNGDGRTDFLLPNLNFDLFESTGSGWTYASITAPPSWCSGDAYGCRVSGGLGPYVGDFNGDGKTDFMNANGNFDFFMSDGKNVEWHSQGPCGWSTTAHGCLNGLANHTQVGDYNGDGRTDVMAANGNFDTWLSNGWTFNYTNSPPPSWATNASDAINSGSNLAFVGDFNGDGKTDWLSAEGNFDDYLSNGHGTPTDALVQVANGMGGTISVAYTPSTHWPNTNDPGEQPTVTSVTVNDGRGWSSTTSYSYAGGLFDYQDRRFLGYHYVKKTLPAVPGESAGPYTETWYHQNYGSLSKVDEEKIWSSSGVLLKDIQNQYIENGSTIPYVSELYGSWEYDYNGSGTACSAWPCAYGTRTYVENHWDNENTSTASWPSCSYSSTTHQTTCTATFQAGYGNITARYFFGDYDDSSDNRKVYYAFYPNTTAYIVSEVAYEELEDWNGGLLSLTQNYYDGGAWNSPPTVGDMTSTAEWVDASNSYVYEHMAYDTYGNKISATDPLGNVTQYAYDATYHLFGTSTTNPLGQSASAAWDPVCGVETSVTDLNGQATTYTYDPLCRLTKTAKPGGNYELVYYQNFGSPTTQYIETDTPPADGSSVAQWKDTYLDGLGRNYETCDKGPSTICRQSKYDARGQLYQVSLPYYSGAPVYWVTTTYDDLGRPSRITNPDGTSVSKCYSENAMDTYDELGHGVWEQKDAFGQVVAHMELHNGTWYRANYAYNLRGQVVQKTDPAGNVTSFTWDSLGRKTQMVDPDTGTTTYAYDAMSRLTSETDARGQVTTLAYDALGRMTGETLNAGTPTASTVSWAYDQANAGYYNVGHETTVTDALGSRSNNYDAVGHLVYWTRSISAPSGSGTTSGGTLSGGTTSGGTVSSGTATASPIYTFQQGFDAGGRLKWITFPDGDTEGTPTTPMTYDGAGRLYSIPGVVNSATYDANGQLLSQANANGTTTTRTVTSRGWVTAITTTLPGGATEQSLGFTFDGEGKITAVSSPFANEGWSYTYDDRHELTGATSASSATYNQSFAYDAQGLGNITSGPLGSYTYPLAGASQPHAVTGAGSNAYSYDADGELLSGAGRTLSWNGARELAGASGWTYAYDADGNRLEKISPSGAVTTYLGDDYEIAPGGQVTKYISIGSTVVAKRVGNGTSATTYWIHVGSEGSFNSITDGSGQEVYRMKYLPFGDRLETDTTAATPAGFTESRGFTGQRQEDTGLFFLHARYYDPQLARFVSPDPTIPSAQLIGLNHYAYAGNDPIDLSDTNGLDAWWNDKTPPPQYIIVEGTGETGFGDAGAPPAGVSAQFYTTPAACGGDSGKGMMADTGVNINTSGGVLGTAWGILNDDPSVINSRSNMADWSPCVAQSILSDHHGDLSGIIVDGHSAGCWSALIAGVQGHAKTVALYGCPGNVWINVNAGTSRSPDWVYIPDHSAWITVNGVNVFVVDNADDPVPHSGPLCSNGKDVMTPGQYKLFQIHQHLSPATQRLIEKNGGDDYASAFAQAGTDDKSAALSATAGAAYNAWRKYGNPIKKHCYTGDYYTGGSDGGNDPHTYYHGGGHRVW